MYSGHIIHTDRELFVSRFTDLILNYILSIINSLVPLKFCNSVGSSVVAVHQGFLWLVVVSNVYKTGSVH